MRILLLMAQVLAFYNRRGHLPNGVIGGQLRRGKFVRFIPTEREKANPAPGLRQRNNNQRPAEALRERGADVFGKTVIPQNIGDKQRLVGVLRPGGGKRKLRHKKAHARG